MNYDIKAWKDWSGDHFQKALEFFGACEGLNKSAMWHALRTITVTGTDPSRLLGLSPYGTPKMVFDEKMLLTKPFKGNFRTIIGTACEDAIIDMVADILHAGVKATCEGHYAHPKARPWSRSQIDAVLDTPQFGLIPLEIKTSAYGGGFGEGCSIDDNGTILSFSDDIPTYYYTQVQKQLADYQGEQYHPTALYKDFQKALLACANLSSGKINLYMIERDPEMEKQLIEVCDDFVFNNLITGKAPEQSYTELAESFAKENPKKGDLIEDGTARAMAESLKSYQDKAKYWGDLADAEKAKLCALIGEHEGVQDAEGVIATWKSSARSTIDTKRLKAEKPEIYEAYSKASTVRTFRLK